MKNGMEVNILEEKIKNKSAVVGIIGLGYVGLPLAVEVAINGYEVVGFDVDETKIDFIANHQSYINDVDDEELYKVVSSNVLKATNDFSLLNKMDIIVVCVPTPIDKHQQPNVSYIKEAAHSISRNISPNTLVVLESTTYPNTTEELMLPILEASNLKVGEDFFLAYSPERVDPGNKEFKTKNIPKIVGGISSQCLHIASEFYMNIIEGDIHGVSSPAVAEMAKVLENIFRNINIGLANEMAIICDKMNIDVWEVIDAAATKPFGFMPFYPGPGLGGHCIPIDPFYLSWKAKEYKYQIRLIDSSNEVNNSMPEFVINKLIRILNDNDKTLKNSNILILGASYKKDIKDERESPIFEIIKMMEEFKAKIHYHDPYIDKVVHNFNEYYSIDLDYEDLKNYDLTLIITDHSVYDYEKILKFSKLVFDTRNAAKVLGSEKENYFKL